MGTGRTCDVFMFIASCDETRTQTPTAAFPEKPAKKVRDFDVFTYGSVVRLHRNASRAVRLQLPFRRGPRPDAFPERMADLVPPRTYFVPDGVVGVRLGVALRRHRHRFVLSMFVSPRPLAPTFKGYPTGLWVFSRKREYLLANPSDRRREWAYFAASTVTKIWGRRAGHLFRNGKRLQPHYKNASISLRTLRRSLQLVEDENRFVCVLLTL